MYVILYMRNQARIKDLLGNRTVIDQYWLSWHSFNITFKKLISVHFIDRILLYILFLYYTVCIYINKTI